MPIKITVIFNNPIDPQTFEAGYSSGHLELAASLPGVERVEGAKVWPKEDGCSTPVYRLVEVYFPSYDAASDAVETPEAAVWLADVQRLATGGMTAVFSDVERS